MCQTIKIDERSELFLELNVYALRADKTEQGFIEVYSALRKLSSRVHPRPDKTDKPNCVETGNLAQKETVHICGRISTRIERNIE